jgi:hypothetical protein
MIALSIDPRSLVSPLPRRLPASLIAPAATFVALASPRPFVRTAFAARNFALRLFGNRWRDFARQRFFRDG